MKFLARREMDEVLTEVFGEEAVGFQQDQDLQGDPLESSDDSDEENNIPDSSTSHSSINPSHLE